MRESFWSTLLEPMQFCRDQLKHSALHESLCQLIDQQRNWLDLLGSAPFLITEALHTIYGRRAIVLVDEYEAPLNDALDHDYLSPASSFFRRMYSLLLKVSSSDDPRFCIDC
jgi:hypothetical protein